MSKAFSNPVRKATALLAVAGLLAPIVLAAQQAETGYTFKSRPELVLVNVSVRDRNGSLVRDLKPEDFTVLEDNKPQKMASFDIENTETTPVVQQVEQVNLLTSTPKKVRATAANPNPVPSAEQQAIKDRRLIILFFDVSSMQPDEIQRSVDAAQNYLR